MADECGISIAVAVNYVIQHIWKKSQLPLILLPNAFPLRNPSNCMSISSGKFFRSNTEMNLNYGIFWITLRPQLFFCFCRLWIQLKKQILHKNYCDNIEAGNYELSQLSPWNNPFESLFLIAIKKWTQLISFFWREYGQGSNLRVLQRSLWVHIFHIGMWNHAMCAALGLQMLNSQIK